MTGRYDKSRQHRAETLPYRTMSLADIGRLPIPDLADTSCHLWLWTTNQFLRQGYDLAAKWGFKVLAPVHWIKPSGCGAWWVSRTQTLLHCYRGKLDMRAKLRPNVLFAPATRHSVKPPAFYDLIEDVSHPARLELFARNVRTGWTSVGDGVDGIDVFDSLKTLAA